MNAPRTTRRGLIGTGAAVLLAGATSQAAAVHIGAVAPAAEPHPDAELLELLAAFDQIVTEKRAAYASCQTVAEDEAIDAQIEPLEERQDVLLDLICTTPARTVAGLRARARSLMLYDGGSRITAADNPDDYHDRRLISALVRDLAAEG